MPIGLAFAEIGFKAKDGGRFMFMPEKFELSEICPGCVSRVMCGMDTVSRAMLTCQARPNASWKLTASAKSST